VQSVVANDKDDDGDTDWTSTYYYGASGQLTSVGIDDDRDRTVTLINNMPGQIIRRDEADGNTSAGDPHEIYYRYGGKQLGYVGNSGTIETDYTESIANRTRTTGSGAFQYGCTPAICAAITHLENAIHP
jgi:hypothetical protein